MSCCGGGGGAAANNTNNGSTPVQIAVNSGNGTATPASPGAGAAKDYDFVIKLLMLGDSGVGKTCLLVRFADDVFHESFMATIGIDLKSKVIELDGKKVKLQIWDTAGQERFRTITAAYYRGAMGIFICFDITDVNSFNNVRTWIQNLEKNAAGKVSKILVGTKADLEEQRAVSQEDARALATEFGMKYYETSSKNSEGVTEVFKELSREVRKRLALDQRDTNSAY